MRRRWLGVLFALILFSAGSRNASAEEGLFVTRASGGIAVGDTGFETIGSLWNASWDYMVTERLGITGSLHFFYRDVEQTLGGGLGLKYLVVEGFWKRLYIHASPEWLLSWPEVGERQADLAVRGGLGFEHLISWGFGYVIELHGTAPMGRGDLEPEDSASAGLTVGLFMEF